MKIFYKFICIMLLLLIFVFSNNMLAQVPQNVTFQGKLLNANGQPFNGTKNMSFTVGTWSKQMTVPVINGLYAVVLDIPESVFNGSNIKLKIKVDEQDLLPDTDFLSVPYAYRSISADKLNNNPPSFYLQTLSLNGNELTISNGNTITLPSGNGGEGVIQDLTLDNDTLKITDNNNATPIDLKIYVQDLVLNEDTLKITNNDEATLIDLTPYKQTLSLNGGNLSISDGNSVNLAMVEEDPKMGSLTENYVPKWGTSSLENSLIYSNLGKVGIGITANLQARLHIEQNQADDVLRAVANGSSGVAGNFSIATNNNNSSALRAFTSGTGYAGHFSITNNSSTAPALFASTSGNGNAGKFVANTNGSVLDVQNDNTESSSVGLTSFATGTGVYGYTNTGRGVHGHATTNGVGVYGYSENSTGGHFQTGNITQYALKSEGKFLATQNVRIDGNTGMGGEPNAAYRLYVYGNAYATGIWETSDATLKTNIQPIESALQKVLKVDGVSYDWIDKNRGESRRIGFLAQNLANVFPEFVKFDGTNYAVQYGPMTAVLVEAFKEMNAQNEELRAENKRLSDEIELIKKMIDEIKAGTTK